jgi:hypothetical protein
MSNFHLTEMAVGEQWDHLNLIRLIHYRYNQLIFDFTLLLYAWIGR